MNHQRTNQSQTHWNTTLFTALCLLAFPVIARANEPADRFVQAISANPDIPEEAKKVIEETWSDCDDCDGAEFLTQGLTVLSEEFRAGLDAYNDDEYETCIDNLEPLRQDPNPFIAVNAAAWQIKAMVALERPIEALDRIAELTTPDSGRVSEYSYFAAEIDFLRGFCLLGDLQYDDARTALEGFLERHPDASQRLTLSAEQMLLELGNREPGQIGEVVDLMNYSGRRLAQLDSGDDVQGKQKRIIDLLEEMIDEAEQREQQSSSSSSKGGSGGQQGQRPSNPMQESQLPGGPGADGPLRGDRRATPGEAWGSMPPAQREKILQALKDSFPGRYRRLVEQYYEELAKKP